MEKLLIGGVSLLAAITGATIAHLWTKRRECVSITMDMYRRFYEPEMHDARVVGAKFLLDSSQPAAFSDLWGNEETLAAYNHLTRVVYFWFELHNLNTVGMIDRRLARRIFRYPYSYWRPLLKKLCEDAVASANSDQDWLELFDAGEGKLDWLL